MRVKLVIVILLPLAFAVSPIHAAGWELFWSDEFDSTGLNQGNWQVHTPDSWHETYTSWFSAGHDQPGSNVFVNNGRLIIEVRKDTAAPSHISSGWISGQGLKTFKYGRIEARMRLPFGNGYWPGMMLVGAKGLWPSCGEIDLMEAKVSPPNKVLGAYFFSGASPAVRGDHTVDTGNLHDDFHTYSIEWSTDSICWFLDSLKYLSLSRTQFPSAPLDTPYFMEMFVVTPNRAFGSEFPDSQTVFPESLIVDYVRVYHWNEASAAGKNQGTRLGPDNRRFYSISCRKNTINVSFRTIDKYSLSLFTSNGSRIATKTGVAREFRMDVKEEKPGICFLRIMSASKNSATRVTIIR